MTPPLGVMKSYITTFKIAAAIISLPCSFLLAVSVINFNAFDVVVFVGLLSLFWGVDWLLYTGKRFAFAVSYLLAVALWLPLLYRTIKQINFLLQNGGMERSDGQGSPLAFLTGFAIEQFFFVPLSAVVIAGIMYRLRSNKPAEPTP